MEMGREEGRGEGNVKKGRKEKEGRREER
jgi:hypothetical protein